MSSTLIAESQRRKRKIKGERDVGTLNPLEAVLFAGGQETFTLGEEGVRTITTRCLFVSL
jgi:hypothetical protein